MASATASISRDYSRRSSRCSSQVPAGIVGRFNNSCFRFVVDLKFLVRREHRELGDPRLSRLSDFLLYVFLFLGWSGFFGGFVWMAVIDTL